MSATKTIRTYFFVLSAFMLSIAATSVFAEDEIRSSTSVHHSKSQRDSGAAGTLSKDEHQALVTDGKRAIFLLKFGA